MQSLRCFSLYLPIAALLWACTCDGFLGAATPALTVPAQEAEEIVAGERYRLDFGHVEVGRSKVLAFTLRNDGTSALRVTALAVGGEHAEWFDVDPGGLELAAGSEGSLTIELKPGDEGPATASLGFSTNDERSPEVLVELTGIGFQRTIDVQPGSLDFGNVVVGTSVDAEIEITNEREWQAFVRVTEVSHVTGEASFAVSWPSSSLDEWVVLEGGASTTLEVVYAPATAGLDQAKLVLASCERCAPVEVDLRGVAIASGLVVIPTGLDLGHVLPGHTASEEVSFENVGNVPVELFSLRLTSVTGGESDPAFSFESAPSPVVLEPQGEVRVTVGFAPEALGSHSAALRWYTDDPRNPEGMVALIGTGGGPRIELVPDVVTFGEVAVGASLDRRVVILNTGYDPLSIQELRLSGDSAFQLAEEPEMPHGIAAGDLLELTLRYSPVSEGDSLGELLVRSDDREHPELSGSLHAAAITLPPCELELGPSPLSFGIGPPGSTLELPLFITNLLGQGACLLRDIRLSSDDGGAFTISEGAADALLLDAGDTHRVSISFSPPEARDFVGELELYVSSPDAPRQTVSLTGVGLAGSLEAIPRSLDFGVVGAACQLRARELCIFNTGSIAAGITGLEIQLTRGTGSFAFRAVPEGVQNGEGETIEPGERLCLIVDFAPLGAGAHDGLIRVEVEEQTGSLVVPVSGVLDMTSGDPAAACLHGRICAPAGTPWVPDASVRVEFQSGSGELSASQTLTDPQGFFYLEGVPAGTWNLEARKGSFSTATQIEVQQGLTVLSPICLDGGSAGIAVSWPPGYSSSHYPFIWLGATNITIYGQCSGSVWECTDPADPDPPEHCACWHEWAEFETNADVLRQYDIVVVSDDHTGPEGLLPTFVSEGGILLVQSTGGRLVESEWPAMLSNGAGDPVTVSGQRIVVNHPSLVDRLGSNEVFVTEPTYATRVDFVADQVEVMAELLHTNQHGEEVRNPLLMRFDHGAGTVFYIPWRPAYGAPTRLEADLLVFFFMQL